MSFAPLPLAVSPEPLSAPGGAPFSFADTPRLTRALKNGDESAFRFLHAQWNQRLTRYCFALAECDATLARDIVQNTYLRIFRHLRELPAEEILWNWIVCAARSAASDLRRTGGRYQKAIARFTEWLHLQKRDPIEQTDDLVIGAALEKAMATLTEEERALLDARYVAQWSLEQAGIHFGTSARAIEGRLARIRAKLRQRIAAELAAHRSGENRR
ncbi:MAG TPA: sigma-70 family RNA polymerase sigma factor [Chthoniobacteraceae bacterium]|nr:sigma-70 family RNA polymerase sigma factor [Chthoniobacteraceae bacterium]